MVRHFEVFRDVFEQKTIRSRARSEITTSSRFYNKSVTQNNDFFHMSYV